MKDWWVLIPLCVYLAAVIGSLIVARRLRPTRWPFKEEDRLLRGPGESLRKEVARIDETMLCELAGGTIVALLVIPSSIGLSKQLGAGSGQALSAAGLAFLSITILSVWRILGLWRKRQNYHLGWFGERLVAEKLAPLRFSGWRVFHDVPFVSNGKPFNIDHVVVGEGGLFSIETKTRRKGGAPDDAAGHEVEFDGLALHWPRQKNDESGLKQAERSATTLSAWVETEIGQKVPATPILVIPGWSLKLTGKLGRRPCRVDSANWIQNTFKGRSPCIPKATVDLLVLRLLAKCRDVED
jgi:hypothetical protein